jgi:hypothetical protein
METTKISKKIISTKVVTEVEPTAVEVTEATEKVRIDIMSDIVERGDQLYGVTYKIKPPQYEHALYITINDIILNKGTEHECKHPFEIFINSKNMEHFQWILGITRVLSAVFRKGGEITFIIDELKAVFDPNGGYFKKGGVFMPSIVAEIGHCLEDHFKAIGVIKCKMDDHTKQYLEQKKQEFEKQNGINNTTDGFPPNAVMCNKCSNKSVILMDGCFTCLNCGDSKCT